VVGAATVVVSPVSWTHHQIWLVLAVLLPVSRRPAVDWAWRLAVLAVMLLPVTSADRLLPGAAGSLLGDGRLLLAIGVACLVPLTDPRIRAGTQPPAPRPPTTAKPQTAKPQTAKPQTAKPQTAQPQTARPSRTGRAVAAARRPAVEPGKPAANEPG
jgi:alpha-1,2-mannosyltransferase